VKIALEVWSPSYDQVESTCRLAESLGLDGFYYGESPHDLNLDCWTTLAALARCTERIRLGPVITNILPTYRSTALLAKQVATVASMSEGRIDFRTGVGAATSFGRRWWEPFGVNYPGYDDRLSDLRMALPALRQTWTGESLPPCIAQRPTIPITIAAKGDRALGLAAAYADVWETSFCTPAEFSERDVRFAEMGGGRNILRSLEIDGFLSQTSGGLNHLLDRVRSERGPVEDLEPVLERALVGIPSDAVGRLRELKAAGVDQVVVALHDPHDPDAIAAIGETAAQLRR
jgi:alkanesulfonate monooxygenase SsuD/methylene tetrahydromethanopterin reductase-like flavin-dependent oxidoreductase (luciferase family)